MSQRENKNSIRQKDMNVKDFTACFQKSSIHAICYKYLK